MNKNKLSKKLTNALNKQVTQEAFSSQIYLSYGTWADSEGFCGIAKFLFNHSVEERLHMMKIVDYILKRGAKVEIVLIPAPPEDPINVNNCFEKVYEYEVENTKNIYKIVKFSLEEEDWATWDIMQCFVKEQLEEETFALGLLNKMKILGAEKADNDALYLIDRDILGMTLQ